MKYRQLEISKGKKLPGGTRLARVRTVQEKGGFGSRCRSRVAVLVFFFFSEPGSKFLAEKDRYHLYVSYACPWAHRTLITRALKGLEDVISVTVVHPIWQETRPRDEKDHHIGWIFGDATEKGTLKNAKGLGGPFSWTYPDTEPDPSPLKAKSVRELYEKAGDTDGKYSVPVLWDKKNNTIVSNESSDIIRMFNSEFNEFSKYPDLDLAPKDLEEAMKEADSWIYPNLNNGVYRCGFATTQAAYDVAIEDLTNAFDRTEDILSSQRYITGDRFTLSDIRLFVTLLRFDEVYVVYFKTNTRRVMDSPTLLNYCREIYQMPGVKDTVNIEHIKTHYYSSHPVLNEYSIIPRGKGKGEYEALLSEPHNRNPL